MAKTKNKTKSQGTKVPDFSVLSSNRTELPSYEEWVSNKPKWLSEICFLVGKKFIKRAKKLLCEEDLQEKMANHSDSKHKFYTIYTIAVLLEETDQFERAAQYFTDLLNICDMPDIKELSLIYMKRGIMNTKCGECVQAINDFTKAKELDPDNIYTWNNLAGAIMKMGRLEEAMDLLKEAVAINPEYREGYSNLLLDYQYLPDVKSSEIFEESKKWAKIQAPATLARTDHDNSLDPHRKLRIGYVSPDFRHHSVAFYLESLLDGHDRNKFEIYGYGNVEKPDAVTERLIDKFDSYRSIYKIKDKEVVEHIMADKIDILVELAGHTGKNSLHVFAYKPAPIQVSYLGYPNTTGMTQMDYRLTDEIADPPDQQQYYTEKLVYLPNGFLCYDPGGATLKVKELPMLHEDYITFGCFNNINKLSPVLAKAWVEILNAVPNSRLLLKFAEGKCTEVRQYYYDLFAEYGLENPKEKLILSGWLADADHFELYNNVDIALDTYPYNGTTTTCQALLMGVPIITLVGDRHTSRVGLDILTRIEMEFFAANTPDEYVKKAVALAANPEALTKIRKTMRKRLAVSPLCNYGLITNDIENAYRKMWHDYCASKGVEIKEAESQGDPDYEPLRISDYTVLDNIISADECYQAGERIKAVEYAMKAFNKLSSENCDEKPPQQLLQRYNVDDLQSLVVDFCTKLYAFSSCLAQNVYVKIYSMAKQINPLDPEIDLKVGLLKAFQARWANSKLQDQYIDLLEITDRRLNNERSKAALALAKGELKELSLPYDLARIHLYPDLKNFTTYVLLEQQDWFEKTDLDFFRLIIRPDDIVFDLGANVGLYSISAAARTKGKVIAVEPALETFELLNRSASQFPNMTAVHAAVSDESGTAFLSHEDSSENFKISDSNETEGEEVSLNTVDDIAAAHGIESVDIIKMDVEGHELKAIDGAEKIIKNGDPIIFYEINVNGEFHPELIKTFEDIGYDSYFVLPDARTIVKYDRDLSVDKYLLNMIAIRPQSLHRLEGLANVEQSQTELMDAR